MTNKLFFTQIFDTCKSNIRRTRLAINDTLSKNKDKFGRSSTL